MATHMVKVREDLLQKLITLSQETGKPMSDLIEEVLEWARQQVDDFRLASSVPQCCGKRAAISFASSVAIFPQVVPSARRT